MNQDSDSFGKFNKNFQIKVLTLFISNRDNFLLDYIGHFQIDYFEMENLR